MLRDPFRQQILAAQALGLLQVGSGAFLRNLKRAVRVLEGSVFGVVEPRRMERWEVGPHARVMLRGVNPIEY